MKHSLRLGLGLILTVWAGSARVGGAELAPAVGAVATASVDTWSAVWRDETRDRDVPVKLYFPKETATNGAAGARLPVIIFSHGLGGSREGYGYLGEYWAAHGYVSVHVQHAGSDEAVWKDARRPMKAMREAVADPAAIANRPLDVKFVLDRLTALAADPVFVLHGRLDLDRVGMAGHSFGAFTTMAVAGQSFSRGGAMTAKWADPRVKAAIAMSTPVPERRQGAAKTAGHGYDGVRIPVFHFTGTEDADAMGGVSDPALRRVPYDETTNAPAWLLVLTGGDHRVFSGPMKPERARLAGLQGRDKDRSRDPAFQALIQRATTRFWDAQLKGDAEAAAWLDDGGLAREAGELATIEHKKP